MQVADVFKMGHQGGRGRGDGDHDRDDHGRGGQGHRHHRGHWDDDHRGHKFWCWDD